MRMFLVALFTTALLPHHATAQVQRASEWRIGSALAATLANDAAWMPLIDRSTLSVGRYRLQAAAKDHQNPHDKDEIYYVIAGKAKFTAGDDTRSLHAGDVPTEQTPYAENSARGASRIFYWYGPDSAGQVALDYGRPRWAASYEQFLNKPSGQR